VCRSTIKKRKKTRPSHMSKNFVKLVVKRNVSIRRDRCSIMQSVQVSHVYSLKFSAKKESKLRRNSEISLQIKKTMLLKRK
jgi:hypothetical protein